MTQIVLNGQQFKISSAKTLINRQTTTIKSGAPNGLHQTSLLDSCEWSVSHRNSGSCPVCQSQGSQRSRLRSLCYLVEATTGTAERRLSLRAHLCVFQYTGAWRWESQLKNQGLSRFCLSGSLGNVKQYFAQTSAKHQ